MASVLAIISKAQFEEVVRSRPGGTKPGDVLGVDTYRSTHKALSPLLDGGSLFLVTIRPPEERLWLVGVLESPRQIEGAWAAKPGRAPITDITAIRTELRFANGKGVPVGPGKLAMSLQTPRSLTDADERILRASLGAAPPSKSTPTPDAPSPLAPVASKPAKPSQQTAPAPELGST